MRLGRRATTKAKNAWGDLVPFLEALGTRRESSATESISRLIDLLARAECPESVKFVTSIPGGEKRGAQVLKKLKLSAVHILSPTVGEWTRESLTAWCMDVGVPAAKIHLKWLNEEDRRPD